MVSGRGLQVQQQCARVLHRLLDLLQEEDSFSPVNQPVVVGQGHIHHGPDLHLQGRGGERDGCGTGGEGRGERWVRHGRGGERDGCGTGGEGRDMGEAQEGRGERWVRHRRGGERWVRHRRGGERDG